MLFTENFSVRLNQADIYSVLAFFALLCIVRYLVAFANFIY